MAVIAVPQRDHAPALALLKQLNRQPAKGKTHHPVHRIGFPRAHQIGKLLDDGSLAGPFLDLAGKPVPDPGDVALGRGFRSEEHTSELQSLMRISYAVFCLKKKNQNTTI